MKENLLRWFFKKLQDDNQCLLYKGSFNDNLTYKLVSLSEANLKHKKESVKTQRRVSYLMAECFQNIIRHGDGVKDESQIHKDSSFFMTRNSQGKYYILSGNLIKDENINSLKSQIDQLNTLNSDELKELHKKVLTNGIVSEKGGAGLGFIDMARKSGHKLGYVFKKFNKDSSIFYNQIVLKSDFNNDVSQDDKLCIESAIDFHNLLIKENILMVQKGDFSQESILPVLNIIERSIVSASSNSKVMKHLYRAMVEFLQNISKHAYTTNEYKEGVFCLSREEDTFVLGTGNCIHAANVESLEHFLNKINSLSKDELENWYSDRLMEGILNDSDEIGLGLIDLAQILSNKFTFSFEPIDENQSFFTISVAI